MSNVRTCANCPRLAAIRDRHNALARAASATGSRGVKAALEAFRRDMSRGTAVGESESAAAYATGYDGVPYAIGDRVELHPDCDVTRTLLGAVGVVVGMVPTTADRVRVRFDAVPWAQPFAGSEATFRKVAP